MKTGQSLSKQGVSQADERYSVCGIQRIARRDMLFVVDSVPFFEAHKILLRTVNVGCIPSKAMLNNSHMYHQIKHDTKNRGIDGSSSVSIDPGLY